MCLCTIEVDAGTTKRKLTKPSPTNTLQVSIPRKLIKIMCPLNHQTILMEPVQENKLSEQQISPSLEGERTHHRLSRKGRSSTCEYNCT